MKSVWCQLQWKTWCFTAACAPVKMKALIQASYFHPGELMGHIPILLIAGDFLQIKPANEISLADNLEELIRKMPHRVQTEHHAAQAALMTIDTVIHLKKSKRFLDAHLPEITTAMRTCTPAAPLSEDHLAQLRTRKIENCKKELTTDLFKHGHVIGMYWENIARSMVERANRDAQDLDVPLFCLQAADTSAAHCSKPASHWQIARRATGAREHGCATGGCLGSTPWIG